MHVVRSALALLGLLIAATAQAWGPHGHQVVAEIAARELTPEARVEVERLLGDRASNAMREVASWADGIRNEPQWRNTGTWHYLNFERGDCSYNPRENCAGGNCVVAAIEREVKVLADRKSDTRKRANALRFVIHFVGDVHQPLHAGLSQDRGGNDFQIRNRREGDNLHGFWDQDIIRAARHKLDVSAHVADLLRAPGPSGDFAWQRRAPGLWAEQSCRIVQQPDFYPPRGRVDDVYVQQYAAVADAQLESAGHRLAQLLNSVLQPAR